MPDPIMMGIVIMAIVATLVSFIMRKLRQPYVIGYILAGAIIGPFGLSLISDDNLMSIIGNLGIVLLLFFVGMDFSIQRLLSQWKITIVGVLGQLACSMILTWLIGSVLGWSWQTSLLASFVLVMSSTAIVLKVLDSWKETNTALGQSVLSISIVHDILAIPLLMATQIMGSQSTALGTTIIQIAIGSILVIGVIFIIYKQKIQLPRLSSDPEISIFIGIVMSFGIAIIATLFGLSAALGSFIAGLIISSTRQDSNLRSSLSPFTIVFVTIFFIYVGMLFDLDFFLANLSIIFALVLCVFLLNTTTMALTLRVLGYTWHESFHAAAILSHIGEFSFVMVLSASASGLISATYAKLFVATIILSMILSPVWMNIAKRMMRIDEKYIKLLNIREMISQAHRRAVKTSPQAPQKDTGFEEIKL